MDVLIKGLPLPQEGEYDYHLTIRSDGKVEGTQQVGERIHTIHTWAIELPPHGYLGDLSELSMTLYSELEAQAPKTLGGVMQIIKKVFDDAPTVLEASNE